MGFTDTSDVQLLVLRIDRMLCHTSGNSKRRPQPLEVYGLLRFSLNVFHLTYAT